MESGSWCSFKVKDKTRSNKAKTRTGPRVGPKGRIEGQASGDLTPGASRHPLSRRRGDSPRNRDGIANGAFPMTRIPANAWNLVDPLFPESPLLPSLFRRGEEGLGEMG
jgi:hypothetical protein